MEGGKLRHRVTWQQYTITNSSGQAIPSYTGSTDYWAFVEPLSGREAIIAKTQRADVTHKVTLRNIGAVKPMDRFIFKTRTLEIVSVMNVDERGLELNCICIEVIQ